ncbi:MAG: shikimate kinase [Candidatus Acididesulfobacter guangdongensis]|uniref:Shikimate kinase n=1 Tax=Acididesulfobacter guangdongensis TaxID=2597225 RepID=A0A519BFD7_ACIG2|nr:MAG: shikimate kinase [Candidatus Acididesulfobacter guangdongensis]
MKNNLFLIGFMGAGKTEIGKVLAKKLNYNFIDSDDIIENNEQNTITEIFKLKGENYFRNLETEFIKSFAANCANSDFADNKTASNKNEHCVIATGGGMPCFNRNINFLKDIGTVVYLKARPDTIYSRIKEEKHRPVLNKTDFSISDIENLLNKREPFYTQADLIIYTDGISPEGAADEIKIFLK